MFRHATALVVVVLLLAACDGRIAVDRSGQSLAGFEQGQGELSWQGLRPCVDCAAIESTLTLRWSGEARDYSLTEIYASADGGIPFDDDGRWHHAGDLIVLEGEAGPRRAYRLLQDGSLQARAVDGRAIDGVEDILLPLGGSHAQDDFE